MVNQEFQDQIRFLVLQTHDSLDKLRIEEDSFRACDWVNTDNGMDAGYRVFADKTTVGTSEADHLF